MIDFLDRMVTECLKGMGNTCTESLPTRGWQRSARPHPWLFPWKGRCRIRIDLNLFYKHLPLRIPETLTPCIESLYLKFLGRGKKVGDCRPGNAPGQPRASREDRQNDKTDGAQGGDRCVLLSSPVEAGITQTLEHAVLVRLANVFYPEGERGLLGSSAS